MIFKRFVMKKEIMLKQYKNFLLSAFYQLYNIYICFLDLSKNQLILIIQRLSGYKNVESRI